MPQISIRIGPTTPYFIFQYTVQVGEGATIAAVKTYVVPMNVLSQYEKLDMIEEDHAQLKALLSDPATLTITGTIIDAWIMGDGSAGD